MLSQEVSSEEGSQVAPEEKEQTLTRSQVAHRALINLERASQLVEQPSTGFEFAERARNETFQQIVEGLAKDDDEFPPETLEQISTTYDLPLSKVPPIPDPTFFDPQHGRRIREAMAHFPVESPEKTAQPLQALQSIDEIHQRLDEAGVQPLEIPEFNTDLIKRTIADRILRQDEAKLGEVEEPALEDDEEQASLSLLQPMASTEDLPEGKQVFQQLPKRRGDVDDMERLQADLQDLLRDGLQQTLSSDNPRVNSERLLSTFSAAIHELEGEIDITDVEQLIKAADEIVQGLVGPIGLASLSKSPIGDVSDLTELFEPHLRELLNTNKLSLDKMESIQKEFDISLFKFREAAKRGDVPNINDEILNFSQYINTHIANPQLKQNLLRDLQITKEELQTEFGEILGRQTGIHAPLSLIRAVEITQPRTTQILGKKMDVLIKAAERALGVLQLTEANITDDVKIEEDAIAAHDKDSSNELPDETSIGLQSKSIRRQLVKGLRALNKLADKHELATIVPGQGSRKVRIFARSKGVPNSLHEILKQLKETRKQMLSTESRMIRTPQQTEDHVSTEADFIKEIRKLDVISRERRRSRRKRNTILKHTGKTKIGKIQILQDEQGDKRELIIPPNSTTGDLMKLVAMLSMEEGSLEDHDGRVLLKIQKNQKNLKIIIRRIMQEMQRNAGHDIRLIWYHTHIKGGHFLDGIFKSIVDRPFTTIAQGGSFAANGAHILNPFHTVAQLPLSAFTRFRKHR